MQGLTEERKAELRAWAESQKASGLTEARKAELREWAAYNKPKEVSGGTKALEIPKGLARGAISGAAEQVFAAAAKDYDEYASAYVSAQDFLGKKRAVERREGRCWPAAPCDARDADVPALAGNDRSGRAVRGDVAA